MALIMSGESKINSILKLTRHSAIYGTGHVITKSLSILLLPIHTNYVNKLEYGAATQLFAFLAIVSIIYSYGLNTACLQYYIQESDQGKKNKFFSTAFFSTLFTSIIFSIVIFGLKNTLAQMLFDSVDFSYLILYSMGILTADALVLLSFNILRAEEKSASFAFFSVANVGLNLVFNIVFVAKLSLGVKGIFLANVFSSAFIFILLLPVTLKYLKLKISFDLLLRMLKFGLPFVPSTMAIVLMNSIDKIFVKEYIGIEASGVYGAGYKLGLIVKLFINGFQFAWIPFFISTAKQENAKEIFSKILTYFSFICSVIFLLVIMYIDQIVRIRIFGLTIFGEQYWGSTIIVPMVVLGYIAYGFYLNFLVGIYLKEKTKLLVLITGSGAIVNIIGNFLLIPIFNIMGAAYSTAISFGFMTILIYFLSQKYYPVKYEFGKIIKILAVSVLIFLIYIYVNIPFGFFGKILLLLLYLIILFVAGFFDSNEISSLKQYIKKFSGKNGR
jgi:O-antigen/teichoic acid export membrane protein